MQDFNGKLVVITGATGGFGTELTYSFLREGAEILLTDISDTTLKSFVTKVKGLGKGKILGSIAVDLTTKEGCEDLVKYTIGYSEFGPDILINNAGLASFGPFQETPNARWEKIMELNLLAPMRLTHEFLPKMIKRGSGHIANVSSVAGLVASPGLAAYSSSKFGIRAFGEALAKEVKPFGLGVTNIYPFFTRTPILQSEQFGVSERKEIPDFLLSDPRDVIQDLLQGIKNNSLHVYPGPISLLFDFLSRLAPGILGEFADKFYK